MSLTTSRVILPRLELNTKIVPKRLVSAKDFSKQDYVKCILVKDLTLSWQSVRLRIWLGCQVDPYRQRSHCVVSMSKTLYLLLSTGSTQEDPSRHD